MGSLGDLVKSIQATHYPDGLPGYDHFDVGDKVQIITPFQDGRFFHGNETGTVIRNAGRYLSIIVKFDVPREEENGHILEEYNFEPGDLIILKKYPEYEARQKICSSDSVTCSICGLQGAGVAFESTAYYLCPVCLKEAASRLNMKGNVKDSKRLAGPVSAESSNSFGR